MTSAKNTMRYSQRPEMSESTNPSSKGGRPSNPTIETPPYNPEIYNKPLAGAIAARDETVEALKIVELKVRHAVHECDMDALRLAKRERRTLENVLKSQLKTITQLRKQFATAGQGVSP